MESNWWTPGFVANAQQVYKAESFKYYLYIIWIIHIFNGFYFDIYVLLHFLGAFVIFRF